MDPSWDCSTVTPRQRYWLEDAARVADAARSRAACLGDDRDLGDDFALGDILNVWLRRGAFAERGGGCWILCDCDQTPDGSSSAGCGRDRSSSMAPTGTGGTGGGGTGGGGSLPVGSVKACDDEALVDGGVGDDAKIGAGGWCPHVGRLRDVWYTRSCFEWYVGRK